MVLVDPIYYLSLLTLLSIASSFLNKKYPWTILTVIFLLVNDIFEITKNERKNIILESLNIDILKST